MADASDTMAACGILIPAYNEAETVAAVVRVALDSRLGPVLVIDDGSIDFTSDVAREAGAQVLRLPSNVGKGGAVAAGAKAIESRVVLLLDADLIGLTPEHLRSLAEPVLSGRADMSRGVFEGGRWSTTAAQKMLPQLNGQRAVRRALLLGLEELAESRYGIEVVITEAARSGHWRTVDVGMEGVSQRMKEEKRGFWNGVAARAKMYGDIVRALFGFRRD